MRMNDAFIDAFKTKPRKACRRKVWPPRIQVRASRPASDQAADFQLYLLLSAEVAYNEEETLSISYAPSTDDIIADDWEVA